MTEPEERARRDAQITRLHRAGLSESRIAEQVGMTQPGIHYALKRLRGEPRIRTRKADQ